MADHESSDRRGPGFAPGLEAFNALLRRTLAMPPKPHSEMKLGKPRGRKAGKTSNIHAGIARQQRDG